MDRPPIADGALVLSHGKILRVGDFGSLASEFPAHELHDFGAAVILPGLVNAHAHLELSHLRPPERPGRFTDWLTTVMRSPALGADRAVTDGAAQSVRFGVTTVGDVTRDPANTRPVLERSPLRAVSYGEVTGMAGRRHLLAGRLDAAVDWQPHGQKGRVIAGISPHAPYSIDASGYHACLNAAQSRGLALATHLAESPHEAEFLADHTGPFRELWDAMGAWEPTVPKFSGGSIRYARSLGLLDDPRVALIHVNYCDDDELGLLAAGRASVVYCPRTHAYFGHPPHRWRDMLAAGLNVSVGTDSRASSPDLNLVDELRLLHRLCPEVPALTLWKMATINAGRALDLEVGALQSVMPADLAIFPIRGDQPLAELLENDVVPKEVWVGGRPVTSKGAPRKST